MKRSILILAVILTAISATKAGGLLTNTNQSVHFLRNPARGASTEIDAVYTNPAGLIRLNQGWHFNITNQSAFQTRKITSTAALFKGSVDHLGEDTREFKGTASAPIVPSVMAAYRIGDWAISGSFAISGGGGKATFNQGLPSFESVVAMAPVLVQRAGAAMPGSGYNANMYQVDQYMNGSSFIYGTQLGATYKINDMFSIYAGFRLNIVNNGYEGYMRGLRVNLSSNMGHNGDMVYARELFEALYAKAETPEEKAALSIISHASSDEGARVDVSQSGWGVSPILGAHFTYKGLDIGARYEFRTSLSIENKTKIDDTGLFKDGVNTPHDIPGLFAIGASYKIIPQLKVSVGYHKFFDSEAEMDKNKQHYISGGTNEFLAGIEYQISPRVLISSGMQITRQGVKDAYQSDLSFALNSYSIGVGGAVNITDKIRLNIAYFWTDYSKWTKNSHSDIGGITRDVFHRTNKVFGVGVDFSF